MLFVRQKANRSIIKEFNQSKDIRIDIMIDLNIANKLTMCYMITIYQHGGVRLDVLSG